MIRVYRLNCGSSGAEDAALTETIRTSRYLEWAETPEEADVFVMTGPARHDLRIALLRVWRDHIANRAPLVALGRASIDGQPFGRGGISEITEVEAIAKVDGIAPAPEVIETALRQAVQMWERRDQEVRS